VIQKLNRPYKPISIHDVANAFNITDQSMRLIAKTNGMPWKKLKKKPSQQNREHFGTSLANVVENLGHSLCSLNR